MKNYLKYRNILFIVAVVVTGLFFFREQIWDRDDVAIATMDYQSDEAKRMYVQISGAVCNPGVYELESGARIFELIDAAGGLLPDAYADSINMVSELKDSQKLVIYTSKEWEERVKSQEDNGIVNINTASRESLMTLPGIGGARADAIVEYRLEHGDFSSIEDIMKVSGIKDAAYAKIKDYICVE